jgi:hypothetical protein
MHRYRIEFKFTTRFGIKFLYLDYTNLSIATKSIDPSINRSSINECRILDVEI